MTKYRVGLDGNGHWLVSYGQSGKPIALFYAHNVASYVARRRADRFVEAMK